jgi:small subunit ribosomal protein S8
MPHSRLRKRSPASSSREGFIVGAWIPRWTGRARCCASSCATPRATSSILRGLRRVSKPGLRRYVPVSDDLPRPWGGNGHAIISTSRGIMSDREARQAKVGGEVLCYVW